MVPARQSHYRLNSKAAVFDELKIPYPKKGAKHSTNSDILESLQSEFEIVGHALEYGSLMKVNSTYVEGIR